MSTDTTNTEAKNAALLDALRETADNLAAVLDGSREPSADMLTTAKAALRAVHPGAALLTKVEALTSERNLLREQVKAVRTRLDEKRADADRVAEMYATPGLNATKRTAYLIRNVLHEVRTALDCRPGCDRAHGGKHSWE